MWCVSVLLLVARGVLTNRVCCCCQAAAEEAARTAAERAGIGQWLSGLVLGEAKVKWNACSPVPQPKCPFPAQSKAANVSKMLDRYES